MIISLYPVIKPVRVLLPLNSINCFHSDALLKRRLLRYWACLLYLFIMLRLFDHLDLRLVYNGGLHCFFSIYEFLYRNFFICSFCWLGRIYKPNSGIGLDLPGFKFHPIFLLTWNYRGNLFKVITWSGY